MSTFLRFSVASLFAVLLSSAYAAPIDLTKGLEKFTWGMKTEDLLREAKAKYGEENVSTEKEYAGGYLGDAVVVKQGSVDTRFHFMQDQFFAFSRTINTKLDGYATRDDIAKADLTAEARKLFVAPEGISINLHYNETGSADNRITSMVVTLSVKNTVLEKKIIADIQAKSPSLIETVIAPLGKP
jgi:hypothetical protein